MRAKARWYRAACLFVWPPLCVGPPCFLLAFTSIQVCRARKLASLFGILDTPSCRTSGQSCLDLSRTSVKLCEEVLSCAVRETKAGIPNQVWNWRGCQAASCRSQHLCLLEHQCDAGAIPGSGRKQHRPKLQGPLVGYGVDSVALSSRYEPLSPRSLAPRFAGQCSFSARCKDHLKHDCEAKRQTERRTGCNDVTPPRRIIGVATCLTWPRPDCSQA